MKISLVISIIFYALNSAGQIQYQGTVLNEMKIPLIGVEVTVFDVEGIKVVSVYSDHKGIFYLDVNLMDHDTVKMQSEKYEVLNISGLQFKLNKEAIFYLQLLPILIKEVAIIKKGDAIRQNKDTTFYSIKKSANSFDRLKDLFGDLPGLELRENGKVYFKGRVISNILIDGESIFTDDYTLALKHISAKYIGEIQAIEHYQEIGLYRNLRPSNEIVLNLKMRDEYKDVNNQQFELLFSDVSGWGATANRMDLGKFKGLTLLSKNNFNIGLEGDMEMDTSLASEAELNAFFPFSLDRNHPAAARHQKDRDGQFSHNSVLPMFKNLRLSTRIEMDQKKLQGDLNSFTRIQANDFLERHEIVKQLSDDAKRSYTFNLKPKISEKTYFFVELLGTTKDNNLQKDVLSPVSAYRKDNRSYVSTYANKLEFHRRIGEGEVFYIKSQIAMEMLSEQFYVGEANISQSNRIQLSSKFVELGYVLKNKFLQNEISLKYRNKQWRIGENEFSHLIRSSEISYSPSMEVRDIVIKGALNVEIMQKSTYFELLQLDLKPTLIRPSFQLNINWKPTIEHQITTAATFGNFDHSLYQILPYQIFTDVATTYQGTAKNGHSTSFLWIGNYSYTNLFNQMFGNLSFVYGATNNTVGAKYHVLTESLNLRGWMQPQLGTLSLNAQLSKFLNPFNGTMKLQLQKVFNEFVVGIGDVSKIVRMNSTKYQISYKTSNSEGVNLNLNSKLNFTDLDGKRASITLNNSIELSYKFRKWGMLTVNYEDYHSKNGTQSNRFSDLKTKLYFPINKRIEMQLSATNLLNHKRYVDYVIGPNETRVTEYLLSPRSIYFQLAFQI